MTYHALEFELIRKFSEGLYVDVNFNWNRHLLDVFEGNQENGLTPTDSFNRALDKGRTDGSEPILLTTNLVWLLPIGRGQRFLDLPSGLGYSVLNHIIGGWTVSNFTTISAGYIYTPTYSGFDSTGTGISSGRADVVCGSGKEERGGGFWWDPSCFRVPSTTGDATGEPLGRFGNAKRGSLRGPNWWLASSGLFKDFPLPLSWRETAPKLRFSFQTRNTWNHPSRGGLFGCNSNTTSGAFGACPLGGMPPYFTSYRQVWMTAQVVW
jgi:hypothetical protein